MVCDVKTGKDIYDDVFLQLSAYKQAYEEAGGEEVGIGVVLLSTGKDGMATGKYKFQEGEYCFQEFLAAKKLWVWQNQDKIASLKKQVEAKKRRDKRKGGD